jgi:hypothetical protein
MIVVGLTTIPERLDKGLTRRCVESMIDQSVRPDFIVVNVPEISAKGVKYDKDKAFDLSRLDPRVVVNWGVSDEGPITKLFGTLDFISSRSISQGKILLVDDDVKYARRLVQVLTEHPKRAVGFAGRKCITENGDVKDLYFYDERYKEEMEASFLETFAGVCYDISLFDVHDMRRWTKTLPPDCFFVDDIVIGAWLWKRKVKPTKVLTDEKLYNHDAQDTPQLSHTNLSSRNVIVARQLHAMGYFNDRPSSMKYITFILLMCVVVAMTLIYTR